MALFILKALAFVLVLAWTTTIIHQLTKKDDQ